MASLISGLTKNEQQELMEDLNYLNLAEIKRFCEKHSIPYKIVVRRENGKRRETSDNDRKGVILKRVRHFLQTGLVLPETCLPSSVVCFDPLPTNLRASDRLFYGQYDKTNRAMITLLKNLTDGKFRNGAIARIVARNFWTKGEAPTFQQYASAWLQATLEHTRPNPEWAFLSDRANKTAGPDWKSLRAVKARKVLRILNGISSIR